MSFEEELRKKAEEFEYPGLRPDLMDQIVEQRKDNRKKGLIWWFIPTLLIAGFGAGLSTHFFTPLIQSSAITKSQITSNHQQKIIHDTIYLPVEKTKEVEKIVYRNVVSNAAINENIIHLQQEKNQLTFQYNQLNNQLNQKIQMGLAENTQLKTQLEILQNQLIEKESELSQLQKASLQISAELASKNLENKQPENTTTTSVSGAQTSSIISPEVPKKFQKSHYYVGSVLGNNSANFLSKSEKSIQDNTFLKDMLRGYHQGKGTSAQVNFGVQFKNNWFTEISFSQNNFNSTIKYQKHDPTFSGLPQLPGQKASNGQDFSILATPIIDINTDMKYSYYGLGLNLGYRFEYKRLMAAPVFGMSINYLDRFVGYMNPDGSPNFHHFTNTSYTKNIQTFGSLGLQAGLRIFKHSYIFAQPNYILGLTTTEDNIIKNRHIAWGLNGGFQIAF